MAELDATDAFDLEIGGQGPRRELGEIVRAQLVRHPLDDAMNPFRNARQRLATLLRENGGLPVPVDALHRHGQTPERREGLARHGAGDDISADHDAIHARAPNLLEHRFERWQIAVDVVDRGGAPDAARLPRRGVPPDTDAMNHGSRTLARLTGAGQRHRTLIA